MAEEMVSGPDLGGGYLHQLTVRAQGELQRFTFHAQVGGEDASGPPLGPLDPLGFVHPPSACPFGGPRCWHRSFDVPPEAAPSVRPAYNRMRFVLTTLLEQRYAALAPAIDSALIEIVTRLGDAEAKPPYWWYVGGSTAAWLQDASITPADIDLGLEAAGVSWVAERFKEYLVEPFALTVWTDDRPMLAARAFVGTMREGAWTEWGAFRGSRSRPEPLDEWSGDPRTVRTRTVLFHGRSVIVSRPEYAWVRAVEKGVLDRAAAIADSVRSLGVDRELVNALLDRSPLPPERRRTALADLLD